MNPNNNNKQQQTIAFETVTDVTSASRKNYTQTFQPISEDFKSQQETITLQTCLQHLKITRIHPTLPDNPVHPIPSGKIQVTDPLTQGKYYFLTRSGDRELPKTFLQMYYRTISFRPPPPPPLCINCMLLKSVEFETRWISLVDWFRNTGIR